MFHWTNEAYAELVEERKKKDRPLPPAKHIRHAGHHWLARRDPTSGGGMLQSLMVAQWSPNEREWFHSGDLATTAKRIGELNLWVWVAAIEVPEMEEIAEAIR